MVDNSILTDSLKQNITKHSNSATNSSCFLYFSHKNLQEQPPQKEPPSETTALEFQHQKKNMRYYFYVER